MPYNYYGYDNRGGGFWNFIPPVTKNIILINILIYIATTINQQFMIEKFAMFYPASPFFKYWQPITYMFMHGGFWHIFLNMYSLLWAQRNLWYFILLQVLGRWLSIPVWSIFNCYTTLSR